jgi:SAM-dependent methyltransferase
VLWTIIRNHIEPRARILEGGAGTGRWLAFLSAKGYLPVGIELDKIAVERFRTKYPDIQYDVGDVESLPYPDGSFDAVVSHGVVEHLIAGPAKALAEMYRVLRPGGVAVVSVPHTNALTSLGVLSSNFAYRFAHHSLLRKLKGLRPLEYDVRRQKQRLKELGRIVVKGLQLRMQYSYRDGITFYEYGFRIEQFEGYIRSAGFDPLEVRLEYSDQMLYRVFGNMMGKMSSRDYRLTRIGRFVETKIPTRFTAGMVVIVAKRN